jgi:DNA polymerase III subunit alpha
VIHDAVTSIRARHGALRHPETGAEYARIEDVPLDDAAVYEMLSRGGTMGVFQFESSLATDRLRAMKCDRFEDLIATNALIRPGPLDSGMTDVYIRRKLGREEVKYPHPLLQEVLEPTYGVITYQEQVMRMAQVLAGFTLAQADVLRKAVGKKDAELIKKEVGRFVELAVANGVDRRIADEIAEQVETFGRYGFNRSHSVAYALLSYQTAWLKRHYPAEFMAALLSSVVDKTDDVVKYIAECRELARYVPGRAGGVRVLPPDVNESGWKFTAVSGEEIRFGLGAVRGLGEGAVRSILAARGEGEFRTLFELVERTELKAVGRRALEALIQAGACDRFGHRAQLLAGLELVLREAQIRQEEEEAGQGSLFDMPGDGAAPSRAEPELPELPRWPESERLAREKEILGFFISGHPLERFRDDLRVFDAVNTGALAAHRDRKVEIACVVTAVSRQISKRNGAEWARITVEDFHGTATVLAFSEAWEAHRDVLVQDAAVLLRGTVSGRDRDEDAPPLFLDDVVPLALVRAGGTLALELLLGGAQDHAVAAVAVAEEVGVEAGNGASGPDDLEAVLERATRALQGSPGRAPIYVRWTGSSGQPAEWRFRSRSLAVAPDDKLLAELRALFGEERVRLVRA